MSGNDLRRLASCPECKAQYDVSDLEVGARFHCACGATATVRADQPHEAAVVRCSSCGGPRQDGVPACGFCGSDFTLHERDLHTICPGCAARISNQARFCHGCGLAISPVTAASQATEQIGPACIEERRLASRELGGPGITVLECQQCAGLWLGSEAFRLVEQRSREVQGEARLADRSNASPPQPPAPAAGRAYRPCPACAKLMHRRNYGRRSGVLIDQCAAHGLWFDQGELETILRWIQDGGLKRSEQLDALKHREEARSRTPTVPVGSLFESKSSSVGTRSMVGALVEFLSFFH